MITRRGFLGTLAALAVAPCLLTPMPALPVCGRCGRVHPAFDPAERVQHIIAAAAREMADQIDRRLITSVYGA